MCGLVGMAGDFNLRHRDAMKDLLFFNTLRGKDSTGLSVFRQRKNEVETIKMTVPGYDFIQQPWIDRMLCLTEGVWLGHGRWKTVGEVTRLNAHPFEVRDENDCINLFGAHNGTLSNKFDIEKEMDGEQFGTDSEALINLVDKVGPEAAIAKARGAWALTWWNAADNSINMLRNKERPLYYAYTKDEKVLMWASEMWMIRIACLRAGVELTENNNKEPAVYVVPEDTWLRFELPDLKGAYKLESPIRKGGLLGAAPEKNNFLGYGPKHWFGYDRDDDGAEPWKTVNKERTSSSEKGKKEADRNASDDDLVGYEGKPISRATVKHLLEAGCDWCGEEMNPKDKFAWLSEWEIVCNHCLKGDHFKIDLNKQELVVPKPKRLMIVGGKES